VRELRRVRRLLPALQLLVDVFDRDVRLVVGLLALGVGAQGDGADPHHRVVIPGLVGALHDLEHARRVAGVVGEQLLRREHVQLLVGGIGLDAPLLPHPQIFAAAGLALERDLAQRLVGVDVFRVDVQPLQVQFDGVVIAALLDELVRLVEQFLRPTLVLRRDRLIAFGKLCHGGHILFAVAGVWSAAERS
jgi:hypothetical protein